MADEAEEPRSNNLPALAAAQGGALVAVLSWPQYAALGESQQLRVGLMVATHRTLNTEAAVEALAEAALFHRENLDNWWRALLGRYAIETITLAIDVLRELGERGDTEFTKDQKIRVRFDLDTMLEVIAQFEGLGYVMSSCEQLCHMIERLGGWEVVQLLGDDDIAVVLEDPQELGRVLREHTLDDATVLAKILESRMGPRKKESDEEEA